MQTTEKTSQDGGTEPQLPYHPVSRITDQIFIGNYRVARDKALLSDLRIRSIFCLDGSLTGIDKASLGVEKIEVMNLKDGPGNSSRLFKTGVELLLKLAEEHSPVLVQCHAGRSRSAAIVTGYLMKRGLPADEALRLIAEKRSISISPALLDLLRTIG